MNIVIGLILLGVLVFFHELGHFLCARLCGVKVESFSIGMGPILLHKTINDTDYRISLLPIGGYCGMKGEEQFRKAVEENLESLPQEPDSLYGTHPLKRALIGFAGPFANLVIAFLAYTIISMVGYIYYTGSATINIPDDANFQSPAREAGIKSGDTITKINNVEIKDFSDIFSEISIRPDEDVTVEVLRNGERIEFTVHTLLNKKQGTGILGVQSSGEIVAREMPTYSFFPAIWQGVLQTGKMIALSIKSIGILFKGVDVTNAVAGPVRISSMLGESTKAGFVEGFRSGFAVLCEFLATISVSLFIMNLLPIPILDGGLILFAIIEAITKKQIPPKIQYKIQIVGIVIIAGIFMIGLSGDVRYFIGKFRVKG